MGMTQQNVYGKKLQSCIKNCAVCGVVFTPTGLAQKYCGVCGPPLKKHAKYVRGKERAAITGKVKNPGVGSGVATGTGKDHPGYKNGIGLFRQYRKGYCETCGKTQNLDVHHIDHNRTNNEESNLKTLCRSCHRKLHNASRKNGGTRAD